ncbi:MAG: hypothetical protein IPG78_13985 [Ignavibacteria bacterium]|nr:hypothetical protein [Ignavibacteria bacterium]
MRTGSEFMPPLDEGSLLFMPTMLNVSISEAKRIVEVQVQNYKSIPRWKQFWEMRRERVPTDPAPVSY